MFRESRSAAQQAFLKTSILEHLSECVKAVQLRHADEEAYRAFGDEDLNNGLCVAIEAMFLHGLKENFFRRARNALSGDPDQRPQPTFWPLLLVLSHRDTIRQISSLQQINTEAGQCRAWIRIALNESSLSSYLSALSKNMNSSKPYYSNHASVRDADFLDLVQRLLEGLESCVQFRLPVNSSLLNAWPEEALASAGLWMPASKGCAVASGVDIAGALTAGESRRQVSIPGAHDPVPAFGHMLSMNLDEAFNYVLSNTPDNFMDDIERARTPKKTDPPREVDRSGPGPESEPAPEPDARPRRPSDASRNDTEADQDEDEIVVEFDEATLPLEVNLHGNSLAGKTTWSSGDRETSRTVNDQFLNTPNLRDLAKGMHGELNPSEEEPEENAKGDPNPASPDDPTLTGLGFEIVSKSPSSVFDAAELQTMINLLGTLSREYGLDSQDYQCKNCNDMLGTSMSKAKVCAYTGQYFCSSCMDGESYVIPARVIHNWDFKTYPVSKRAALFLAEFQHQPLLNMKKINPVIYSGVGEMAQLQTSRIRLNFLRAYLFTCREPVIEDLQKRVWPREYLYEHVHVYSVSDLIQISNGSLATQLQKIVNFAQGHVKDCWLCSQKGFICEVCNDPKILYPFDIETTYRCESCSSVFHSKCLNSSKPCPKCERKKMRFGKSLVEAVHNIH